MGDTSDDSIKAAFAAVLRGDYAERDRLCARGLKQLEAEARSRALEKVLRVDFFVDAGGATYPSREIFRVTN